MSLAALAFVALFLVGCAVALLRHPIFGLMMYIIVLFVSPDDRWWGAGVLGDIRWSLIAASVTLLAVLIHGTSRSAPPFVRQPIVLGLVLFVAWIAIQSTWALDPMMHTEALAGFAKLTVAVYLIFACIDTEERFKLAVWAYVIGCLYFAWIAHTSYTGGRFDDFGGAGIGDSNSGALTLATGIMFGASLFMVSGMGARVALVLMTPFLVNALVMTQSRSGFLAMVVGGAVFNFFAPRRWRKHAIALSVAGAAILLALTHDQYWSRIETISYRGADVTGVDTGSSRLAIIEAQVRMFRGHPFGCGSRCTGFLSPSYLDAKYLSRQGGRDSHNTFMTMLVDHGIIGGLFFVLMVLWLVKNLFVLRSRIGPGEPIMAGLLPATAGGLFAILAGDMFVQYPKLELRFWLIGFVLVMLRLLQVSARSPDGATTMAKESGRVEAVARVSPAPSPQ